MFVYLIADFFKVKQFNRL